MSTTISTTDSTGLTDEQRDFVAAVREFCRREVGTREQRDALTDNGRHPHVPEVYNKVAELGWLGVAVPEEYGGTGGGMVDLCLFLEETSRGQLPIGAFGVSMISAGAVERFLAGPPEDCIVRATCHRERRGARRRFRVAMQRPDRAERVGIGERKRRRRRAQRSREMLFDVAQARRQPRRVGRCRPLGPERRLRRGIPKRVRRAIRAVAVAREIDLEEALRGERVADARALTSRGVRIVTKLAERSVDAPHVGEPRQLHGLSHPCPHPVAAGAVSAKKRPMPSGNAMRDRQPLRR